MFFVGNKKFEKLEHVYEFLKSHIQKCEGDTEKMPPLVIFYNDDQLYSSLTKRSNHIFYISRGVKADLIKAFILKNKGVKGTIRYNNEILWKFNHNK